MKPIDIIVHNRSLFDREAEIVSMGIPFERGAHREVPPLVLLNGEGQKSVTQTHGLSTWDDGSLKFALVQFPVSVARMSKTSVQIAVGKSPVPETTCHVEETAKEVTVDTGCLRFSIVKSGTNGLDRVLLAGREILGNTVTAQFFMVEVWELEGHLLGKIDTVEIEENGPLRAVVRLRGTLIPPENRNIHFGFELVLMAYAGKPWVQTQYTFIANDAQAIHAVERLGLRLRFHPTEGRVAYRVDTEKRPHEDTWGQGDGCALHVFRGVDGKKYFWSKRMQRVRTGKSLPGRFSFRTTEGLVGLAVRDFEENGPGGIRMGWNKVHVEAEIRFYDGAQKTLRLGQGRSRTHDVLWVFAETGANAATVHATLSAFQKPLISTIDPAYFCRTRAFGILRPAGQGPFEKIDRQVRSAFDAWQKEMAADPRNYGMMNYGDFISVSAYGTPEGAFLNQEYDTAHSLYLLYAGSGDPDYLEVAGRLARHFMDVDVNHVSGHQSFHGYPPRMERHEENIMNNQTDWGHIFVDCLVDYYLLTGDRRARRTAGRIAAIARGSAGEPGDGRWGPRYVLKNCERALSWPVIAMARAYEVTGDAAYLETIRTITDYLACYVADPGREYREGGWWWRTIMQDGCKPFMVGLMMEGLIAYHEISRDPTVLDTADHLGQWLAGNMWNDQRGAFEYELNAFQPGHRAFTSDDLLAMPLAYLAAQTRRPEYLHIIRRMMSRKGAGGVDVHGKEFGMATRNLPQLLALYQEIMNEPIPDAGLFRDYQRKRRDVPMPPGKARVVLHAPLDGMLTADADQERRKIEPRTQGSPRWIQGPTGKKAVYFGLQGARYDNEHDGIRNLNLPDHAAYPVPEDLLSTWGAAGIWIHYEKDMRQMGGADPRPLLYIRGILPKRDTLLVTFIYNKVSVRLYDARSWLCGVTDADLSDQEPGAWHHYAVGWQPEGLQLYVDGHLRNTDPDMVLPEGKQQELYLGWCDGNWCSCMGQADLILLRGRVTQDVITGMMQAMHRRTEFLP